MRITDREFFEEKIDLNIPELKSAHELFRGGELSGAYSAVAEYLKRIIRPDIIFNLYPSVMSDGKPEGCDLIGYADLIVEGHMYAVGFLHKYEDRRVVWDYNPTYNGYVEYCFHLNWLGDLSALAYAYRETADERYAVRFAELMRSWLDETESPGKVVSDAGRPTWRSIEAGGRMLRFPTFVAAFRNSASIPDKLWFDMCKSVCEHLDRIVGLNTKYNWHTSEISGTLSAALNFPFFREAAGWREYATAEYIKQVELEIYPDGMQAELSSGYQNSVINHFRNAMRTLSAFGYEPPREMLDGIMKLLSSYVKLVRPDLYITGVNDAGTVFLPNAISNRMDILPEDETLRYFMSERKEGKKPSFKTAILPYSGFVVMRTGWEADDMWSLFDVGPEGTAHIHEDKLNFLLHAYGETMLDDIGFYAYDTSDMRYFTSSSLAHHTGLLDGEGQNRIATHNWGEGVETVEIQTPAWGEYADKNALCEFSYSDNGDCEVAEASYSGAYGVHLTAATHTRKVVFFKSGLGSAKPFYLLLDSFAADDGREHEFSVCFQHKALPITTEQRRTTLHFESGATLTVVSDVPPTVLLGQYSPRYLGWTPIHSPYEHEHTPAPFVEYKKRGLSARFATLVYPSPTNIAPKLSVALNDGGFTVLVDGESFAFSYDDDCLKAEIYVIDNN